MNERLDSIAVFVEVVEAGSFAAAAERLNLTRSAVGKAVARLEQRLGARLFQRTTRQQFLTEEGQLFFEHSLRILAELREAEAAVESGRRKPVGRLRVSVPVLYGRLYVAPLLTELLRQHDDLTLEMSFSDQVVDLVQEGIDLAVRIGPLADSSSLVARYLDTFSMIVCGAPDYFAKNGRPSGVADLRNHKCIVFGRPGYEHPWQVIDEHQQLQSLAPPPRILLNDLQVIADQVLTGLGLACLPSWLIAPYLESGALEMAFDEQHAVKLDIHVVWPKANFLPSRTRVAIDHLTTHYANKPRNG